MNSADPITPLAAGALTFSPGGILFLGDSKLGAVFAFETEPGQPPIMSASHGVFDAAFAPDRSPWSAFQTALELRDGQPIARVRYLSAPPRLAAAHASSASAAGLRPPESVEFATVLSLKLESPCLAAARR